MRKASSYIFRGPSWICPYWLCHHGPHHPSNQMSISVIVYSRIEWENACETPNVMVKQWELWVPGCVYNTGLIKFNGSVEIVNYFSLISSPSKIQNVTLGLTSVRAYCQTGFCSSRVSVAVLSVCFSLSLTADSQGHSTAFHTTTEAMRSLNLLRVRMLRGGASENQTLLKGLGQFDRTCLLGLWMFRSLGLMLVSTISNSLRGDNSQQTHFNTSLCCNY